MLWKSKFKQYSSDEYSRSFNVIDSVVPRFSPINYYHGNLCSRRLKDFLTININVGCVSSAHAPSKIFLPPFPIPHSLFPIPYSLFPIPYSLFPIPYSLFPAKCFLWFGFVDEIDQFYRINPID